MRSLFQNDQTYGTQAITQKQSYNTSIVEMVNLDLQWTTPTFNRSFLLIDINGLVKLREHQTFIPSRHGQGEHYML